MNLSNGYLAGIIDGEGSIMLLGKGKNRSRHLQVAVGMTDKCVPVALQENFGGFIKHSKRTLPQHDMFIWIVQGTKALDVLDRIQPVLVIERRRKLCALAKQWKPAKSRADVVSERQRLFEEMQNMNQVHLNALPVLEQTKTRSVDKAYLAGILDGEGHISPKGRIEVMSTDPELCAWLQMKFGGQATLWPYTNQNRRPCWRWQRSTRRNCTWKKAVSDKMLLTRKSANL